ncbi:MAG: carboxypeptidase regulatory-like domain-containing protein [Candidatus Sumerlaeia bacterium]|nr:carboxypeptidase regulatory-like domain-containing protein [Candidatus Sumerlaeia bacterium]
MTARESPPLILIVTVAVVVALLGVFLSRPGPKSGNAGVRDLSAGHIVREDPAGMTVRTRASPEPSPTPEPTPEPTPPPEPEVGSEELEPIDQAMLLPPGSMRGWLITEDGLAVSGADVRLEFTNLVPNGKPGPDLKTRSAEGGQFEFLEVPPGEWNVIAEHPAYATGIAGAVAVESGRMTDNVDIIMQPAIELDGRVRTSAGVALEGVEVVLARQVVSVSRASGEIVTIEVPYRTIQTDSKGQFRMERAAPGPHVLTATMRGFATERLEVVLEKEAKNSFQIIMVPGSSIGGRVRSDTGLPVGNTRIDLRDPLDSKFKANTTSLPDGSFIIGGLRSERTFRLTAKANNFAPAGPFDIPAGRLENLIILESGGGISGTVTSLESGRPENGMLVTLEATNEEMAFTRKMLTLSDGTYRFGQLPSGTFHVRVQSDRLTCEPRLGVRVRIPNETTGIDFQVYPGKEIRGTVSDATTGERIAGATVKLSSRVGPQFLTRQNNQTTTDAGGMFSVENLPFGLYSLEATAPGYRRYPGPEGTAEVRLLPDETPEPVELYLARGGTVTGNVVDASRAAVRGAIVRLYNTPGAPVRIDTGRLEALTDETGNFTIDGIPLDTDVYLTASATPLGSSIPLDDAGKPRMESPALFGRAKGKSEPIVLTEFLSTANVTIQLGIGGPLTIRVVDARGTSIVDADARIGHDDFSGDRVPDAWSGKTSGMGELVIGNVPAGAGSASASKAGYIGGSRRYTIQDGKAAEVTVTLYEGTFIEGYVFDDVGVPFQEGHVDARAESGARGGGRGNIDARGRFRIEGLGTSGTFTLVANAARSTPTGRHVVVREVPGVDVREKETVIIVPMSGRLEGVVVDKETNQPIPGASVSIEGVYETRPGRTATFRSNAQARQRPGEFNFESLPPATYRLTANASNYLPVTVTDLVVSSPGTYWAGRIALDQGASVQARIVDGSTGEPVAGARLALSPGGRAANSNANGIVTIASLPADIYNATITHARYLPKTVNLVQVPEEGRADMGTIELEQGGKLSGRVTDGFGKPVVGALVTVRYQGEDFKRSARTDGGGRVSMEGLRPGSVTITVTHRFPRGNVTRSIERTITSTQETTFEIELVGTLRLDGTVFSDGRGSVTAAVVDIYPLEFDGTPVLNGRIRATITGVSYRAENMIEGEYLILATATIGERVVQWHDRTMLEYPGKTLPLTPPRGRLNGRVLNRNATYALPDINIRLRLLSAPQSGYAGLKAHWEFTTRSDELGFYEFSNLPVGTYEVVGTEIGSSSPIVLQIIQLERANTTRTFDLIEQ